jgi:hypothetical protein
MSGFKVTNDEHFVVISPCNFFYFFLFYFFYFIFFIKILLFEDTVKLIAIEEKNSLELIRNYHEMLCENRENGGEINKSDSFITR